MIMAAGKGTRMGKITESLPKVLVDIKGKTLLQRAVETCSRHGFGDIIINVHYLADMVEAEIRRLKLAGFRLTISDERDLLLENGGGLYKARNFFDKNPFLLYNADIITDLDITSLYRFHLEKKGLATLAVRNRTGNRFLLVDAEGLLKGWLNKSTGEQILAGEGTGQLAERGFSSVQIIEPEIFRYMEEGIYTIVSKYLELASSHRIFTCLCNDGYWYNVGTPEDLEAAREFLR
jgi:N-acetyl-alpha-D-muramate 1-phosphate uridylyltransferase